MSVKALLFDLDGTLADTATANAKAYAAALAEVGVDVDFTYLINITQGRNWRQFLPPLLAQSDINVDPALIAQRKSILYGTMIKAVSINTPLIKLLMASQAYLKTGLVTTASSVNARNIIDYYELAQLFDIVITGDDVGRHKPDPEAYLIAAKRLGVLPNECIAFEDSEIGISSATAAGVAVIQICFQLKNVLIS